MTGWIDVDGPSAPHVLSYTSAKILIQRSPLHAWLRKRRELEEDEESETAEDGGDVECVGALDLWQPRTATILDLKFVKSAHPDAIRRQMISLGYDIQAAAYTSAVEKIEPRIAGRVSFVFLFCEVSSAAVTPIEMAGSMRALGEMRWRRAVNTWARCLRTERWPAYVKRVTTVDAPPWALEQEMMAASDATAAAWESRMAPTSQTEGEDDASGSDDIPF